MAEIITAQIPNRRKVDSRYSAVHKLYADAEAKLKKAEQQSSLLSIPGVNELRYAGHHLLNAITEVIPDKIDFELQEAQSHCRRAAFDAVEIRLMDHLQRIDKIEDDYKAIELCNIVQDYLALRAKYLAVKTTLKEVEHTCREEYLARCEEHLIDLEAFSSALDLARPELQKAMAKERRDSRNAMMIFGTLIVSVITAIAAILALK